VIDRGEVSTLAALQGDGKSPLVQQLALCAAAGHPFLGFRTHMCRVALIDLESRPDKLRVALLRQAQALGLDARQAGHSLDVFMRGNPADPNSRELERILGVAPIQRGAELQKLVAAREYGLVIVDTALTFWPFKSSDEERVRGIFLWMSMIKSQPPYPSFLLTLHLRKVDRRALPARLLDDPYAWTDEIMGTRVWSTNADVRLGLEVLDRKAHDARYVFAGYRRGYGILPPMILEQAVDLIDGEPRVTRWQRCDPQQAAPTVLTPTQFVAFQKLPVGEWLTWDRLLALTSMPKVSLHRLIERAERAGLLERDKQNHRFIVVADARIRGPDGAVLELSE
jgi:hypothetical protein